MMRILVLVIIIIIASVLFQLLRHSQTCFIADEDLDIGFN